MQGVQMQLGDGNPDGIRGCKQVNSVQWDQRPFYRLTGGWKDDPWANYRHGDVAALCPTFKLGAAA